MKKVDKRHIKPGYGRFLILWTLRKFSDPIVIYDASIPAEATAFNRVHSLMWHLQKRGLATYGSKFVIPGEGITPAPMEAAITIDGRDWIRNKIVRVIQFIFTIIAGIAGIFKLLEVFF